MSENNITKEIEDFKKTDFYKENEFSARRKKNMKNSYDVSVESLDNSAVQRINKRVQDEMKKVNNAHLIALAMAEKIRFD